MSGGDMDIQLVECFECGHGHYDPYRKEYMPCPQAGEGCGCDLNDIRGMEQ